MNDIKKLLNDTLSDITAEISALTQLRAELKEMEGDIHDGLMGSYQEDFLKIAESRLENMKKTKQRLEEYLNSKGGE